MKDGLDVARREAVVKEIAATLAPIVAVGGHVKLGPAVETLLTLAYTAGYSDALKEAIKTVRTQLAAKR